MREKNNNKKKWVHPGVLHLGGEHRQQPGPPRLCRTSPDGTGGLRAGFSTAKMCGCRKCVSSRPCGARAGTQEPALTGLRMEAMPGEGPPASAVTPAQGKEQKEGEKALSVCNYLPHLNNAFVVIIIEHSLTASTWDLTRTSTE